MAQRKAPTKSGSKSRKVIKSTKSASRKAKASSGRKRAPARTKSARDEDATICRRRGAGRRGEDNGKESEQPVLAGPKLERRKKVSRRRQIDPTTCERDYTDEEIRFMNALDAYKRASGRMFPTCSEVLEVVRSLGYVHLSPAELAAHEAASPCTDSDESSETAHSTENHFFQ